MLPVLNFLKPMQDKSMPDPESRPTKSWFLEDGSQASQISICSMEYNMTILCMYAICSKKTKAPNINNIIKCINRLTKSFLVPSIFYAYKHSAYMYVCIPHAYISVLSEVRRCQILRNRSTDSCSLLDGCYEPSLCPLQEE